MGRSGHVFSSWNSTHSCQPQLYFEPSSEEDLRQVDRLYHSLIVVTESRIKCTNNKDSLESTRIQKWSVRKEDRIKSRDKICISLLFLS